MTQLTAGVHRKAMKISGNKELQWSKHDSTRVGLRCVLWTDCRGNYVPLLEQARTRKKQKLNMCHYIVILTKKL